MRPVKPVAFLDSRLRGNDGEGETRAAATLSPTSPPRPAYRKGWCWRRRARPWRFFTGSGRRRRRTCRWQRRWSRHRNPPAHASDLL